MKKEITNKVESRCDASTVRDAGIDNARRTSHCALRALAERRMPSKADNAYVLATRPSTALTSSVITAFPYARSQRQALLCTPPRRPQRLSADGSIGGWHAVRFSSRQAYTAATPQGVGLWH